MKTPEGQRQLTVFNSQSQIQIGGKWNPSLRRVDRPFVGVMAGLVYNGLRPLDLAADADVRTKIQGDVGLLENIPFNYRERNPRLFEVSHSSMAAGSGVYNKIPKSKKDKNNMMQKTNPSMLPEPGVRDDLVYGDVKCITDDERYYDPRCYSFEGSGKQLRQ